MTKLADRQVLFVRHYLISLNATQAAKLAGYAHPEVQGSRLLRNVRVVDEISKGQEKAASELDFKAVDVLRELGRLAFNNMSNYMEIGKDGLPFLDLSNLTPEQAAAISEVGYDAAGNPRIKLADKRAALVDLGRHFALFTDKTEQTLNITQINIRFHGE